MRLQSKPRWNEEISTGTHDMQFVCVCVAKVSTLFAFYTRLCVTFSRNYSEISRIVLSMLFAKTGTKVNRA